MKFSSWLFSKGDCASDEGFENKHEIIGSNLSITIHHLGKNIVFLLKIKKGYKNYQSDRVALWGLSCWLLVFEQTERDQYNKVKRYEEFEVCVVAWLWLWKRLLFITSRRVLPWELGLPESFSENLLHCCIIHFIFFLPIFSTNMIIISL